MENKEGLLFKAMTGLFWVSWFLMQATAAPILFEHFLWDAFDNGIKILFNQGSLLLCRTRLGPPAPPGRRLAGWVVTTRKVPRKLPLTKQGKSLHQGGVKVTHWSFLVSCGLHENIERLPLHMP